MTITLAQMRTNIRDHIDEPSANYWTDAELGRLISNAQLALWRKIYDLKKDFFLNANGFTLTLVAGQYKYVPGSNNVPATLFRITAIRTTTAGSQDVFWVPADPNSDEFQNGLNSDTPIAIASRYLYAVRNNGTIWVSPLPQGAVDAQVDYIERPTAVSADADTFLPVLDEFLDWIEFRATHRALSKGPVGDVGYWKEEEERVWRDIALVLDTPRSNQGPDVVRGFQEDF